MPVTLDEFLVSLGFKVDPAQQNRFVDAIKGSREGVRGLTGHVDEAIKKFADLATVGAGAALTLAGAIAKIAGDMGRLGYQAQIVGASEGNIVAIGYAFEQVGGSVEEARSTLASFNAALRANPALESTLRGYGITAKDRAEQLLQFGDWARHMVETQGKAGLAIAQQVAGQLNISAEALQRIIRPDVRGYYDDQIRMAQQTNTNYTEAAKRGQDLSHQLVELRQHFSNLSAHVAGEFAPKITTALTGINAWLDLHDRQISAYFDHMSTNLDGATTKLTAWWGKLPTEAQEAAGIVAGGLALRTGTGLISQALRFLGMGSLAGPIGAITGVSFVLLGLINDYQTWKDSGGKDSLIDWGKWETSIIKAQDAMRTFKTYLDPIATTIGGWETAFEAFALYLSRGWIAKITAPITWLLKALALIPGSGISMGMLAGLGIIMETKGDQANLSPEDQQKLTNRNQQELQEYFAKYPNYKPPPGATEMAGNFYKAPSQEQSLKGNELMQKLVERYNLTPAQASGVVGNWMDESGLRPGVVNSIGAAGLNQWLGPRRQALEEYARQKGKDWRDPDLQLEFWNYEMRTAPSERRAWEELQRAQTPGEAALAQYHSERPGPTDTTLPDRIGKARSLNQAFTPRIGAAQTPPPAAIPVPPTPPGGMEGPMPGPITMNNTPNITITGVSDPHAVAQLVDRNERRHGSEMVRRLQSVIV